jgi:hypothetical protein
MEAALRRCCRASRGEQVGADAFVLALAGQDLRARSPVCQAPVAPSPPLVTPLGPPSLDSPVARGALAPAAG